MTKWGELFPWLHYDPHHVSGPSMFCALCQKYNESTKRMAWISVPCKQFRKDKLREHERSCHIDATKPETLAPDSLVALVLI